MYYYILFAFIGVLVIWTLGSYLVVRNLEEPSYTVIEKRNGYEIRQYQPYIIAETEVTGSYDEATNAGFRIIADYIFGNNTAKESIAMTTPVLEQTSEKIAMTTPIGDVQVARYNPPLSMPLTLRNAIIIPIE